MYTSNRISRHFVWNDEAVFFLFYLYVGYLLMPPRDRL